MAKKSLFEKLGLVEGVAASEYDMPEAADVNVGISFGPNIEQPVPMQVDVPEGDTIDIQAVYETNGMNPADVVTVYKIKDVIDTFPPEMPTKTKRATVKNLMATLGYDAAAIILDAEQRKELLHNVGNDKMDTLFGEMKNNDQQIESMKEQIEALTNRNVEVGVAIEKITNIVQDELKMISSIEEFIEEDKPEPAGKEAAQ